MTTNREIADTLEELAELLDAQGANPFRVKAYRAAARVIAGWPEPVAGVADVAALPGVGPGIAAAVHELVTTGRLRRLERAQGELSPESLFTTVPGIGAGLARRVHEDLGCETLEDLELAAHDGRLENVPGFGPRRAAAVREVLASRLARSSRRHARYATKGEAAGSARNRPGVPALLDADAEYRRRAAAGELRTIAPRRFNPAGEAWLPILHTEREGWHLTALYSNTALAHRLGTTHDWVILYYERAGEEGQCTVVTETHGPHAGERVVRGREGETPRASLHATG